MKAEDARSNSKAFNELIISLAILKMVATGFRPLKLFQIPVELFLLTVLLYACTTIKYDRKEVYLLMLLVFATACSFVTSSIETSLINGKQNISAILSLLYFSKVRFSSRLIFPAFSSTLLLVLINWIAPEVMAPLIDLSIFSEFNASRFGGLFFNAHFNSCFMAVALIYYGHKKRLFGVDIFIMFVLTGAKVISVSYLANVFTTRTWIRFFVRNRIVVLVCVLSGIYGFWQYRLMLIEFFDTDELGSAVPILMQLFDPAYYRVLLNPFPSGNIDVAGDAIALYRSHDGYNEVGYFGIAMTMGVFLGAFYLFLLLRYAQMYTMFILICLLHFSFPVWEPLLVYMYVSYSMEIQINNLAGGDKKQWRSSSVDMSAPP